AMPDDVRLPPIWLLGSSSTSSVLAAALGLGFAFAGHFSAEPPQGPMRAYRDGFRPGPLGAPHAILALAVFCAETEAAARRMAAPLLVAFAELRSGRPGRLRDPDTALAHRFSPEEEAVLASFRPLVITGTPETVRRRVEEVALRSGADEVMVAS